MMGKSASPDKRCAGHGGMRRIAANSAVRSMVFRAARFSRLAVIRPPDMVFVASSNTKGSNDVERWFVRDRNRLGIRSWRCDGRDPGQGRRAYRRELFLEQD